MRVLFVKPKCPLCEEILSAVDIFNKNHPNRQIEVIHTHLPLSESYNKILYAAFGEEVITPAMIFDGRPILGTAGMYENLSYLNKLDKGVSN